MRKRSVIIVAGGKGLRAGGDIPKQFQIINNKPLLMHTIETFYHFDNQIKIVIVLPDEFKNYWSELLQEYNFVIAHQVINGGETRFHSVRNGLSIIDEDHIVAIHDAARPFVPKEVIERCFQESENFNCGIIPVIEEVNSIRIVSGYESKPFDRAQIRIVQTPQVFPAELLKNAYNAPYQESFTDDATVAELDGIQIKLTEGSAMNFKITTSFDIKLAEFISKSNPSIFSM